MPKPARAVFDNIFAFPPNRETLGATAYFIVKNDVNILLDCPAPDEENQQFLRDQGGVRWLLITHRGGIGKHVKEIQQTFGCEILIQEQEAYLLPGLTVTTFHKEFTLSPTSQVIWTPGHSPGSSCLYQGENGGILFTGRHLLPNRQGNPVPLRTSKTFHWRRQINSVNMLREVFTPETLQYICPGANTGFLRGKGAIAKAYEKLVQLDLDALLQAKPGL
ncbi:MBL fold metallo-hydrolase [Microseira sp. BLCC-F43]|jgi:glyoxylase-like metal-dependent hydrolase (beta-lactamase superfamily II)|uniref:MBL fold metallo-hydrolase n=1 Tax=Microseira sp. BLCC-F43 TaxID=3153602 RepID=UPI0035BB86F1